MSGREKFNRYRRLIGLLVKIIRVLPIGVRWFLWSLLTSHNGNLALVLRYIILKSSAGTVGENVYIGRFVTIKNPQNLHIGDNVSLHEYCYIDAVGTISIGSDVSIAHNVSILSADHSWSNPNIKIKYNEEILKPTSINNDVWIGCGVRILGGVVIESRSIVAAGAVVNKDVLSNTIVGGVPAKIIKSI